MSSNFAGDNKKEREEPEPSPEPTTGATASATMTTTAEDTTKLPKHLHDHDIEDTEEILSFADHFGINRISHQARTESGPIVNPVALFGGSGSNVDLYESDELINALVKCTAEVEKEINQHVNPEEEEKKAKKQKTSDGPNNSDQN